MLARILPKHHSRRRRHLTRRIVPSFFNSTLRPMKIFAPPAGFVLVQLPTGPAWLRPKSKEPILHLWKKLNPKLPLRIVASRHPQRRLYPGRAPVTALPCSGLGEIVVRPCLHGGFWGKLAQDLYCGSHRARHEIDLAQKLHQEKVPTPYILAVCFYPAGPFYRIDVLTSFVPDSRDLASFLSTRPSPLQRRRAFVAVRKLLHRCAQHGIRHHDLNARNILISGLTTSPISAWLLDVDAIRRESGPSSNVATANQNRLLRSLLKRSRLGDLDFSEKEIPKLWREIFPTK